MPPDDRLDDHRLAVEVAIDEPGADSGGLRNVCHAGGLESALDKAFLGGVEDSFALAGGAGSCTRFCRRGYAGFTGELSPEVDHCPVVPRLCSCQPPPSALYKVTRLFCCASRVAIKPCCAP